MARPKKIKPTEAEQMPTQDIPATNVNSEQKTIVTMADNQEKKDYEKFFEQQKKQEKIEKLEDTITKLRKELADSQTILKNSVSNTKSIGDKKIAELNAIIKTKDARIAELEKEMEDVDAEYYLNLEDENESLKQQKQDLETKLEAAQKHTSEIEAQKTGKLIIPVNEFSRKCYITWCETYSKDPRWSENYKHNFAQFEKWGLSPDVLNMPILMVLANMLGKIDSISFDCKIPQDVVRKIAEDCKNAEK